MSLPPESPDRPSDAFIRHVAHDLRASLNAVVGWAELVKSGALPPEDLARAGDTIVRHSRQLSQRLGDALDLWRLDVGLLAVAPRPASVASAVRAAVDAARPQFDSRRVQCRLQVLGDVSAAIDGPRLVQALVALLADAAANTPAGQGVDVVASAEAGDALVRIAGGGRMPEPGWRDRQPADTRTGGTTRPFDFGLPLSHVLIDRQRGTLEVEQAGDRVVFSVRLPAAAPVDAPRPAEERASQDTGRLQGLRVLVVDDQRDAREIVERLLEPHGAVVTAVPSVDAALAALRQGPVDVLVSDIAMPDRDGYDLIQSIRSDARLARLPAAALTAFSTAEDRARVLGAGFQELLAKPVQPALLVATVAALSRRAERRH